MSQKIPLILGFANLSGDDLAPLVSEDARVLSELFERVRIVAPHQIPGAHVLFVYAQLNDDGTIPDMKSCGLRQIAQVTKARIIILASPNPSDRLLKSMSIPGPKLANLIFTLDRKGQLFGQFFYSLFDCMRKGEHMLGAWVHLAPQGRIQNENAPETLMLAEAGKIAFPMPS